MREEGRIARFVCGVRSEMASSSWKAPREVRWDSEEPARRRRGKALALELPTWKDVVLVKWSLDLDVLVGERK